MRKISSQLILLVVFLISLVTVFPAAAETVTTIDFEDAPVGLLPINQYDRLGVAFLQGQATVWEPTSSEAFKKHSGSKAVYNSAAIMRINFASPVSNIGFYYSAPLYSVTCTAYKDVVTNGVKNNVIIGQVTGQSNPGSTTQLSINQPGIEYIIFTNPKTYSYPSSGAIGQFAIDDLSFTPPATNPTNVPEFPSVAVPVAGVLGLLFVFGRKKAGM